MTDFRLRHVAAACSGAALLLSVSLPAAIAQEKPSGEGVACSKPDLPERQLQPVEFNGVIQRAQAYVECMKTAVDAQHVKAEGMIEAARVEADKSNKMAQDVNDFIKAVQRFQAEQKGN